MKRLTSALLAVLMIFASLPVLADTGASSGVVRPMSGSITENHNQGDGVVMVKSATPHLDENGNPDGTIDIMIEAYTTGVVTNTTKVTPADIVLVLDMSGSMKDGEAYETVYTYNPVYGTEYTYREWNWSDWEYDTYTAYGLNNNSGEYYVLVNGEYQRVTRDSHDASGFEYYYYGNRNNRTYVYPILDEDPSSVARENNYSVVQFYTRTGERVQTSKARIDLLKEGVESFIAETLNSNKESGLTDPADLHSISIIKFADDSYYNGTRATTDVTQSVVGNDFNDDDYNYSQVVKELTTVNDAGAAELNAAVEALQPAGATAVDFGLALAQQVFNKAGTSETDNHRNQVLVVFTDGEPNHQNGYDSSVAATAVNYARAMKDAGVTVFTISVADGSDSANITTNINRFMHYLSSNFPKASATGTTLDDGVADSEVAAAMALGYYQTPDDNMSLASIFKTIAHTIESPTIELGEGATVVDTINPYFTLPEGTSEVSLYTSAKNATDWDDPKPAGTDVTLTVQNDRTITVNGFDFDANYVSETPRNGDFYGEKLIIVFNVVPDYDALDAAAEEIAENGGMVPTNLGNATLTDSNMQTVAEVGSPTLQAYKVTYLVDGVEYKTVYRFAGADVTLIDEPADTAALDYGEWASDDVTIVDNGFIMPAEDVVIHLTSTRVSYKVTYRYTGPVPAGAAPAPGEETYDNGTTVSVAAEPYVEGYVFSGWITSSVTVTNGEFTMPAADVEFIGYFTAGTTMYTVEHYLQNADGTWPTDPTNSHTHDGTTGETVTARTDIVYPNFVWDEGHDGEVLSGVVAADGSLVLKLYYKRLQYNVTYEYVGTVPAGAPALPNNGAPTLHYYNERVIIADVPYVQGYTFVGWSTERADVIIEEDANGKYIIMPAHDVVIKGTFIANTDTGYSVEHWLEGENGNYEYKETTTHTGTTGDTAYGLPGNYVNYSYNATKSAPTASGVIKADGSLVLVLYYDRTPFTVSYQITGDILPAGYEAYIPDPADYDWGDTVTVADDINIPGYIFSGWKTTAVTITNNQFEMPTHDVILVGQFYREQATYDVEHYLMDTNGNYSDTPYESYTRTGNVGYEATADYLSFNGFTPDTDYAGTVAKGTIISNKDGKLVLKLYYERTKFKVTYEYTGNLIPEGALEQLPAIVEYYYGATVTVAADPVVAGYTFYGWTTEDAILNGYTFAMPARNVVLKGYFEANTGVEYDVEHWLERTDGKYYLEKTSTHNNGTVGETATASPESFRGYTYVPGHDLEVASGEIPAEGKLVLKLYYDRNPYKVTYTIEGDIIPYGVVDPADQTHDYLSVVNVEPGYDITGYTFIGWTTTGAIVSNGQFTMPAADVHFVGRFVLDTSEYTVNHYMQNADGTWPDVDAPTYTHTYENVQVGKTVVARTDMVYPNFVLDENYTATYGLTTGVVDKEGTLILKVYYRRVQYNVTYEYVGTVPTGAPALPNNGAPIAYYYDGQVFIEAEPYVEGYTFVGWTTDGADAYIQTDASGAKYFVMPARDVVLKGTFTANTGTIYTVEHWLETEDGKYERADSTERNGTTGTEANALPGNYPGYTYDPQISTASGIIKGDGSLVLKLYYNKTHYKVYYNITGNIPDGLEWTTKEETHDYSDTVTVLTAPVIAGYRFVGWTTDDVTIKDGEFTMPSYDVYLTGYYVATTAGYKVEHYFQEVDGTWSEEPTLAYNITGNIGAQVSADYLVVDGFTADRNHEGTLLAGEIKADGSLTLKLYYARNKYKVTYVYTGKVPTGAAEQLPEEATYYYGAEVDIAGQPYVSGYTFHGWTSEQIDVVGQTFDMPAKDVKFSGYFVAGPSYYTVEHYKQNLDGTYNATPDDSVVVSDNVKVGDYVTAEFMNYTGFTPAANNVFSGTVTPEPDTLVIKLYYERRSYNVYYEYTGVQPEGAPDVSVNNLVAVKYGEVVKVADIPTLADYAFDGWHTHTATVVGGEFTMPAHDVLFTGNFVLTRSSYRVEHYLQNLDGTWSDTTPYSQVIGGTIGNTVSADYNDYTGFTPDLDNEKTVIEGVVNAEGTLVLKLYYERNKYTVTYVYGSAPDTAPALPAEKTYYYGENVTVADDPAIDHFTFTGWTTADATITDGKFDMPAKNVTITGSFTQDDFIYKVNYYVNDELYASYEVYSNDVHVIIDKPDYPAPLVFIGWSDPVNDATGKIVPVVNGAFVMPEANVSIFGSVESRLPINNEGRLTIGKELEAPDGFPKKIFTFDIYRAEGTRLTYVDTVAVKAGEEIALDLRIGVYFIYEKDAEVEGYTLFTTSDVTDNRVVIKAGRATSITFTNSYFTNILETEDHFAYVIGYPDGLVRPEANITRAEVATIFFRMLTDEAREQYWSKTNNFSDVSESDWFNNAISTLANAGVLNGYTDGTFKPNAYITRAELVKIAVSFYGTQAGKSTHFSDASEHWATDFIAAAEEFGFVDGYEDGTFRPDKYVTRAEAMKIINRTLDRNPHKDQLLDYMITWADNSDTSKWYYADVQEATNSHTYTWDIYGFEVWDALLPVRDWAAFEKEWSTAYSD